MMKNSFSFLWVLTGLLPATGVALPVEKVFVQGGTVTEKGVAVIASYQITRYEITNAQYAAFLNSKGIEVDGKSKGLSLINVGARELRLKWNNKKWTVVNGYEKYPVVMVSYYGAVAFSSWMGGRLPTVAQWQYAAGGGIKSHNFIFSGSNLLQDVGWYSGNAQGLHSVGEKKPNGLGIYDMSGNAWEWCMNDSLTSAMDFRVHMGGSWSAAEQPCRLDARYGNLPTHFSNSVGFRVVFVDTGFVNFNKKTYAGKPWNNKAQEVPGRVQNELYDLGGHGVAYHDTDSINNGSGRLNPPNGTFLNEFRQGEGVDISYTKSNSIDNSSFNLVQPEMDQLYAGWTVPGEWINYSIYVKKKGLYSITLMYTASGDGEVILLLNGKELSPVLFIPSTRNEKETIPWRNWHHWNRIDKLATVQLQKGRHVLTLKTVSNGNMNYDFIQFSSINNDK